MKKEKNLEKSQNTPLHCFRKFDTIFGVGGDKGATPRNTPKTEQE